MLILPAFAEDDFFDPYSSDVFKKDISFDKDEYNSSRRTINALKDVSPTIDLKKEFENNMEAVKKSLYGENGEKRTWDVQKLKSDYAEFKNTPNKDAIRNLNKFDSTKGMAEMNVICNAKITQLQAKEMLAGKPDQQITKDIASLRSIIDVTEKKDSTVKSKLQENNAQQIKYTIKADKLNRDMINNEKVIDQKVKSIGVLTGQSNGISREIDQLRMEIASLGGGEGGNALVYGDTKMSAMNRAEVIKMKQNEESQKELENVLQKTLMLGNPTKEETIMIGEILFAKPSKPSKPSPGNNNNSTSSAPDNSAAIAAKTAQVNAKVENKKTVDTKNSNEKKDKKTEETNLAVNNKTSDQNKQIMKTNLNDLKKNTALNNNNQQIKNESQQKQKDLEKKANGNGSNPAKNNPQPPKQPAIIPNNKKKDGEDDNDKKDKKKSNPLGDLLKNIFGNKDKKDKTTDKTVDDKKDKPERRLMIKS
jgi:hypothetical protein